MHAVLRTAWLTIANEGRLLRKDPVAALLLLIAPIVIMTAAGYSMGSLFGSRSRDDAMPIVDHDGGAIAREIAAAFGDRSSFRAEVVADEAEALARVRGGEGAPIAVVIPAGTGQALREGREAKLVAVVDPVRRIEVDAFELALAHVGRELGERLRVEAQARLDEAIAGERTQASTLEERARTRLEAERKAALRTIETQIDETIEKLRRDADAERRDAAVRLRAAIEPRESALRRIADALQGLERVRREFAEWMQRLTEAAGKHAKDIPPPPALPDPPDARDVALLREPIDLSFLEHAPEAAAKPKLEIRIPTPAAGSLRAPDAPATPPRLPSTLGLEEKSAAPGARLIVNAFDQYVPGFGVTFLLIGMMLGIALTLFDERDWGTLKRLQASGASLAGVVVGKVLARFVVGVVQMIVLFAVGHWMFDISLGSRPEALLLPTIAMSFAGAALGLVVASIATSHDSVMPVGTMISLSMAAIGGCWWPVGFEPAWMRAIGRWMPTTWTMQAYNDLMIRGLPPSAAIEPAAITLGLGCLVLAVGVVTFVRRDG